MQKGKTLHFWQNVSQANLHENWATFSPLHTGTNSTRMKFMTHTRHRTRRYLSSSKESGIFTMHVPDQEASRKFYVDWISSQCFWNPVEEFSLGEWSKVEKIVPLFYDHTHPFNQVLKNVFKIHGQATTLPRRWIHQTTAAPLTMLP